MSMVNAAAARIVSRSAPVSGWFAAVSAGAATAAG